MKSKLLAYVVFIFWLKYTGNFVEFLPFPSIFLQAVFANDSVTVEKLNDLPFPDGYVRTDVTEAIIVTGQKTFQNVLGKPWDELNSILTSFQ